MGMLWEGGDVDQHWDCGFSLNERWTSIGTVASAYTEWIVGSIGGGMGSMWWVLEDKIGLELGLGLGFGLGLGLGSAKRD